MKACFLAMVSLGLIVVVGCSQDDRNETPTSTTKKSADGVKYSLSEEPKGAKEVKEVRESAKDGEEVLIVGRIGGRKNPWIADRAAFPIVDGSLKACSDIPGDRCEMPWDYCCETEKLPSSTALVKVVDENGDLVQTDPRTLLDVKELSTVVVKGKAQRDEEGNLTILAKGVYVRKQ